MCNISVSCSCTLQLLATYHTTSDLHHFVELVTHIRVVHWYAGHFVQLPKEHYRKWGRLEGWMLIAVLWVVLELAVDWVVQSIVAHLEPVVLWVELEVDWVVQSMAVQLEITFFGWLVCFILIHSSSSASLSTLSTSTF